MSDYIMQRPSEPARIRAKTSAVLLDHHLSWTGLGRGDSFVDFGCASGEVVRAAATIVAPGRVLGLDADEAMLRFAEQESQRLGLTDIEYRQTVIGAEGSSQLPTDSFDHAWARFFLEYQLHPVDVIREMTRVVRPGGKVTLIDIDGNCIWHHPTSAGFRAELDEVMADLATTGFDPRIGSRLSTYAASAGLVDVRVNVEPYHWIVGQPDADIASAWTAKLHGIRQNYLGKLFPQKAEKAAFFDSFLALVLAEDTMTWSLAYLVQGTKPA
jgi:ubiquinone/menaquinone biosynthesis C-methylase UbiE